MALEERHILQLMARVGRDNVLRSEADRIVYSTDIGSPPSIVDLLVKRKADAVVRCHDIDDVEKVAQYCLKHNIPMTPRAAATNALGGAVPKRAGVVLDMTAMAKEIQIDEAASTVTVEAGVVIRDLQEKLLEVGLELPTYPTSGNAATIGGFVAMDGHGIHSTRAGSIGKWVRELEGVGMDGRRFRTRNREEVMSLAGLGGATGILTRITLQVVEATKDKPVVVSVKGAKRLQSLMAEVKERFGPKHIMFHNSDFFALRTEALGQKKNPFAGKDVAFFVFPEADFNRLKDDLERVVARHEGQLADDKVAEEEWAGRFFPIRAKVLGPSLVAGEVFVPLDKVATYLRQLRQKTWVRELSVEGHVTDDGRVYFFIFTLDDERRPNYPLGWGTSARILQLAKKHGGNAYHSGVWLQAQSRSVFGATRYKRLRSIKRTADPKNIFNPGMVFPMPAPVPEFVWKAKIQGPVPAPSLGIQLAAGDPVLMMMGGAMKYRRHKTVGVRAADVAGDMARSGASGLGMFTDEIWGADLPSLQAIPNPQGALPMTLTPRGRFVLAKAFVQSKVEDPWTLKPALDVADPAEDDDAVLAVCPDWKRYRPVMDAFRRAVEAEGVELDVKAPVVEVAAEPEAAHPDVEDRETEMSKEEILKMAKNTPEEEKAWVLAADCIVCNGCEAACPTAAAIVTDMARVDRDLCIADGACFDACPTGAIRPGEEDEATSGGWPEGSRLAGKFGV